MKKYENENNIIEADLGKADVSETPTDGQTEGTTSVASSEKDEDEDIDQSLTQILIRLRTLSTIFNRKEL